MTGPLRAAATPDTAYWEDTVSLQALPFLTDHRVRGAAVMPAAAFVEMALTAARSNRQNGPLLLRNIEIREALLLNEPRVVQLMLRPAQPGLEGPAGSDSFKIYSRAMDGQEWSVHAAGHLEPVAVPVSPTAGLADVQARLGNPQPAAEHVQAMQARGLEYGPAFQAIQRMWKAPGEALVELRQPDPGPSFRAQISPSLLDAGFQALIAVETEHEAATYLPVGIEALQFMGDARQPAWAHAIRTSDGADLVGDVTFFDADGGPLLEVRGLRLVRPTVAGRHELDGLFHDRVWRPAAAPDTGASLSGRWLIYDSTGGPGQVLAQAIIDREGIAALGRPGDAFSADDAFHARLNPLVRDDWRQWLDRSGPVRDIVCLYRPTDDPARGAAELTIGLLGLVQALADVDWSTAPRLWLVTFGAQSVSLQDPVNPDLTAVWGLGGVIAHEHPALTCTRVDLSVDNDNAWVTSLVRELAQGSNDGQIAWRGSERFVARLESVDLTGPALQRPDTVATRERPFRVSLTEPGVLDNLSLQSTPRVAPSPGQVEIAVEAAGLNFINVLSAMGVYPGMPNGVGPLGLECAGTVTAVGQGVHDLAPGDAVLAIAYDSLGSHAHADARLVVRKPKALSFAEAATLPIVFVTAWYGLRRLALLQSGERVLIHSATGGVGLAAIQIAQMVGAEVFATAGSPDKRDYLHALGITHVYDSRTLAFADQVLADTGGPGVDVVLNSLTGAAIPAGLSALAPYGRFVEIGKRDVYDNAQLGLWPFQKNLAYFLVDLERMCRERPAFVGAMLNEVIEHITSGELKALPVRVFPAAEVSDAFRHMAQARHIGKIAITSRDGLGVWPAVAGAPAFDGAGTYLITGGLGALGLAVADWMIGQGARHLALMGRTEPSAPVAARLETLRGAGVDCRVLRGGRGPAATTFARSWTTIAREMAPLAESCTPPACWMMASCSNRLPHDSRAVLRAQSGRRLAPASADTRAALRLLGDVLVGGLVDGHARPGQLRGRRTRSWMGWPAHPGARRAGRPSACIGGRGPTSAWRPNSSAATTFGSARGGEPDAGARAGGVGPGAVRRERPNWHPAL